MDGQKTLWDVVSEFGRLGIVGFLLLMLLVWGIVHWQAEPGTEISFAFISYTKPSTRVSKLDNLLDDLVSKFAALSVQVAANNPCGRMTFASKTSTISRILILESNVIANWNEDSITIITGIIRESIDASGSSSDKYSDANQSYAMLKAACLQKK